jgi:hypothetical protein
MCLLGRDEVGCLPRKLGAAGIGGHFEGCQILDVFVQEHSVIDVIWSQLLLVILIEAFDIIVKVIMSKYPM